MLHTLNGLVIMGSISAFPKVNHLSGCLLETLRRGNGVEKPWEPDFTNNDEERYDHKNGITMTPTYHSLFDLGFISFSDNGELLVSPFLSNLNKNKLKFNS